MPLSYVKKSTVICSYQFKLLQQIVVYVYFECLIDYWYLKKKNVEFLFYSIIALDTCSIFGSKFSGWRKLCEWAKLQLQSLYLIATSVSLLNCNFSLLTLTKYTYIIVNGRHKSGKFSLHHERHVPIWCLCVRLYERERERERERGYVNPFNEQPLIFLVRSNRKN